MAWHWHGNGQWSWWSWHHGGWWQGPLEGQADALTVAEAADAAAAAEAARLRLHADRLRLHADRLRLHAYEAAKPEAANTADVAEAAEGWWQCPGQAV